MSQEFDHTLLDDAWLTISPFKVPTMRIDYTHHIKRDDRKKGFYLDPSKQYSSRYRQRIDRGEAGIKWIPSPDLIYMQAVYNPGDGLPAANLRSKRAFITRGYPLFLRATLSKHSVKNAVFQYKENVTDQPLLLQCHPEHHIDLEVEVLCSIPDVYPLVIECWQCNAPRNINCLISPNGTKTCDGRGNLGWFPINSHQWPRVMPSSRNIRTIGARCIRHEDCHRPGWWREGSLSEECAMHAQSDRVCGTWLHPLKHNRVKANVIDIGEAVIFSDLGYL